MSSHIIIIAIINTEIINIGMLNLLSYNDGCDDDDDDHHQVTRIITRHNI